MKKILIIVHALFICAFCFSQPSQVLDINSGSSSSFPLNLFIHNGLIYFSADDSSGSNTPGGMDLGRELWISDGTTAGTMFFKDINSGESGSGPDNFFVFNGNLYFSANSGSGNTLFTTDGTESGTDEVSGVAEVRNPIMFNGLIYHINFGNRTLHQFDGTTSQPVVGSGDEYIQGDQIVGLNNKIFCYANTSSDINTVGTELYAYNLSTQTFELIKDINGNQIESEIYNLTLLGSEIYFSVFEGAEMWKTDGTTGGTIQVSATSGILGFNDFFGWDGKLFFRGWDNSSGQLWVYDPVGDTVTNISNLSGAFPNHDPSDYAELNGWLYYRGEDSNDNDGHLWRTNGIETNQLDNTIINVDDIVTLNDKLYFEGNNGTDGNELFEFDPASLSIHEVFSNKNLTVFPNPAQNSIQISRSFQDDLNYELLDINGRTIQKGLLKNNIIHFELKSGMYLLNLKNAKVNIIKKVIVH